jgi:hypothetical protein
MNCMTGRLDFSGPKVIPIVSAEVMGRVLYIDKISRKEKMKKQTGVRIANCPKIACYLSNLHELNTFEVLALFALH